MDYEFKWYVIAVAVIFLVMFGSLGYTEHTKSECLQAYAQTNRSAAEIKQICGN